MLFLTLRLLIRLYSYSLLHLLLLFLLPLHPPALPPHPLTLTLPPPNPLHLLFFIPHKQTQDRLAGFSTVPHVCPLDYKSIEYRYPDYGFGEFKTTINDVRDGSAILEGSMSSVTLSINDFVAITRSDPSDPFILMSMRLFAENITPLAVTFIDVNKTTIGEGVRIYIASR